MEKLKDCVFEDEGYEFGCGFVGKSGKKFWYVMKCFMVERISDGGVGLCILRLRSFGVFFFFWCIGIFFVMLLGFVIIYFIFIVFEFFFFWCILLWIMFLIFIFLMNGVDWWLGIEERFFKWSRRSEEKFGRFENWVKKEKREKSGWKLMEELRVERVWWE